MFREAIQLKLDGLPKGVTLATTLKPVPLEQKSSIIDAYVQAIERGDRVLGYRMEGYWSDVGTPESYARVRRDVDAGLINLAGRETVSEAR